MDCIELSLNDLQKRSYELADLVKETYEPDLIIFIAKGGYLIGKHLGDRLGVPIVPVYAGMTEELLDLLPVDQLDGLIIQAFGAGNVPKETAQKLKSLCQTGLPIALVSRCFNGIAEPVYAYEGGGICLQKDGVYFVKELNAQKARLKLLIAINAGLKGDQLRAYMEG